MGLLANRQYYPESWYHPAIYRWDLQRSHYYFNIGNSLWRSIDRSQHDWSIYRYYR